MAKTSTSGMVLATIMGIATMVGMAYAAYTFIINPTEHPTPEEICRHLAEAQIVNHCEKGPSTATKTYPGKQWHCSVGDDEGAIMQFTDDEDWNSAADRKWEEDRNEDTIHAALGHPTGPGHHSLEIRYAFNNPRTLVLFPSQVERKLLVPTLKSIFRETGSGMKVLLWSIDGKPMSMDVPDN